MASPGFSTIRSTPRKTALNPYSHNSVTNATTIRPVTHYRGTLLAKCDRLTQAIALFLCRSLAPRLAISEPTRPAESNQATVKKISSPRNYDHNSVRNLSRRREYDNNSVADNSVNTPDRDGSSRILDNSANTAQKSPKSLHSQFGQKCDHNLARNTSTASGFTRKIPAYPTRPRWLCRAHTLIQLKPCKLVLPTDLRHRYFHIRFQPPKQPHKILR